MLVGVSAAWAGIAAQTASASPNKTTWNVRLILARVTVIAPFFLRNRGMKG